MKYLPLIMILGLSLSAGEIDKMEAMLEDIEKLRNDYSKCEKELNKQTLNNILPPSKLENSLKKEIIEKNKTIQGYKKRLDKEIVKNTILISEVDLLKKENKQNKYDKSINNINKVLKIKEKEIINLKNEIARLNKIKENNKNNLILTKKEDVKCVEDNKFPELIMKDSTKEKNITDKKISTIKKEDTTEIQKRMKASTFRLKIDSDIYNSINGDIVYNWEKGRSFTSYIMTESWLKITGYFNAGKWGRAKEDLWIKKTNIQKR